MCYFANHHQEDRRWISTMKPPLTPSPSSVPRPPNKGFAKIRSITRCFFFLPQWVTAFCTELICLFPGLPISSAIQPRTHRHVLPGRDEWLLNYPHKHDMEAHDLIVTGMKTRMKETVIFSQLEQASLEGKYQYSNTDYSSNGLPMIWTLSCRKGWWRRETLLEEWTWKRKKQP